MQIPRDRSLYVLCYPFDEDFIKCQHLRVVYHAPDTDAVVAIRPEAESAGTPTISAAEPDRITINLALLCVFLCVLCVSALNKISRLTTTL